jgi:peptide-methionine (R)-S-oxide reductase
MMEGIVGPILGWIVCRSALPAHPNPTDFVYAETM